MKIKANISISRDSGDTILLRVQDEASHATFLTLEISPHDFMMALTGLAFVDAKSAEVKELDVVGKRKIIENRKAQYPRRYDSRTDMQEWLTEHCKEDGWIVNPYLGSQSSVTSKGDDVILNYTVYRFEAVGQSNNEKKEIQ